MQIQKYVSPDQLHPEKAGIFTRTAKCLAAGKNKSVQLEAAEMQRASPDVLRVLKAATTPLLTSDDGWRAADETFGNASAEFIASIGPASVFYTLAGMSREFPLDTRIIATTAGPQVKRVAEGEALPVTRADLNQIILHPRMCGAILVASDELLESDEPAAFAFLRDELQQAAIHAVDVIAVETATDGVAPTAATTDAVADLRGMLNAVNTKGAGSLMFAMAPDVANILSTMPQDFPQMSPRSGLILNVPALVSDALEPGRIVLIDSLGFAANQGLVTIARSNAAALKLDDEPVMDSTTPTPSGELISLFQSNLTAIRIMAGIGIERIRDTAVAVLDGANGWGA